MIFEKIKVWEEKKKIKERLCLLMKNHDMQADFNTLPMKKLSPHTPNFHTQPWHSVTNQLLRI